MNDEQRTALMVEMAAIMTAARESGIDAQLLEQWRKVRNDWDTWDDDYRRSRQT